MIGVHPSLFAVWEILSGWSCRRSKETKIDLRTGFQLGLPAPGFVAKNFIDTS